MKYNIAFCGYPSRIHLKQLVLNQGRSSFTQHDTDRRRGVRTGCEPGRPHVRSDPKRGKAYGRLRCEREEA